MPDVSEPMVKLFRSYLREKYNGDVEQLRKAWNQPEVTFENAVPPPEDVRMQVLLDVLRDPVTHAWTIDFLHCMQRSVSNALLAVNKAAKEACKGRALIGNYCGYFFGMGYSAEGWHLLNDEFMNSPYVDFQTSPCCYSMRELGNSQLARCLWSSYPLHNKMCIFEADTRTHLAVENRLRLANTVQESIAMLSRDLAQAISKGSAYWYYDFGRDWYNCPEILQFFHKIAPVYDAVKDFGSSAEVAIIADWESGYYHAIQAREGGSQVYASMNTQPRELNNAGIQFDAFSFADIDNPALQKYKLFIFPQLFYMTPEKLAKLSAIKKAGKTLLFLNTPGWLTPHGPDAESVFKTTGIRADVLQQQTYMTLKLSHGPIMEYRGAPASVLVNTRIAVLTPLYGWNTPAGIEITARRHCLSISSLRMAMWALSLPNNTPSGTTEKQRPPTFSERTNKARNNSSVALVLAIDNRLLLMVLFNTLPEKGGLATQRV